MAEQRAELNALIAEICSAAEARREEVQQSLRQAKADAPPRARGRMGHWWRNLVSHHYRESHARLESCAGEAAEAEFRLRAIRLYENLDDQADSLRSRLAETRFSEDLDARLRRGAASLSEDFMRVVSPPHPYRELTEEQRALVADRLEEFKGLIESTMTELDQRIRESDVSKWFAGDSSPAAPSTAAAAVQEESSIETLEGQLEETRSKLQQTHDELSSLRSWTTVLGALWVVDMLSDD